MRLKNLSQNAKILGAEKLRYHSRYILSSLFSTILISLPVVLENDVLAGKLVCLFFKFIFYFDFFNKHFIAEKDLNMLKKK